MKRSLILIALLLFSQVEAHDQGGSVYCSQNGKIRRLSGFGAFTPTWSPDGRSICYFRHRNDENQFFFISPNGELVQTISLPPPLTITAGMSYHPKGELTFAASQGISYDIYRLDHEGQVELILEDGIQPAWSPDGRSLAFTTFRDSNLEVYLLDFEGRLRNLTKHAEMDARSSWSPDGKRIAFESARFGYLEVCVLDVASGEVTRLTNHPGKDWNPAWSPDGREIAFASNRDGENLIYIMNADGTKVRRFDQARVDDWQLSWSPDGKNLCFVSSRPEPFFDWLTRVFLELI